MVRILAKALAKVESLRLSDTTSCYAEEVDTEVLCFHDIKEDNLRKEIQQEIPEQDEEAKKDANPTPESSMLVMP